MEKYIAVVNPRMDDDQIRKLIAQDIAGAIFSVSHQNYPLAAKLIRQVKDLSRKHNKPVSIIQDASGMQDLLDLEFGIKSGVDWVIVSDPTHAQAAKKMDKSIPIIWKSKKTPGSFKPDAVVTKTNPIQIKHFDFRHPKHEIFASLLSIAEHAGVGSILVSDIQIAKALSSMNPSQRIVYQPKDLSKASRAAIFPHVHAVFEGSFAKKGEKILDARDAKHVTINTKK